MEELFNQECVIALKIGMTYEQYWLGEIEMFVVFAEVYKQKQKERFSNQDLQSWMTGFYVERALVEVIGSAFGKKGHKPPSYPSNPVFIQEVDDNTKQKQEELEVQKSYANFVATVLNNGFEIE